MHGLVGRTTGGRVSLTIVYIDTRVVHLVLTHLTTTYYCHIFYCTQGRAAPSQGGQQRVLRDHPRAPGVGADRRTLLLGRNQE